MHKAISVFSMEKLSQYAIDKIVEQDESSDGMSDIVDDESPKIANAPDSDPETKRPVNKFTSKLRVLKNGFIHSW